MKNLDSLGKEVSSLCVVIGGLESGGQLVKDTNAGNIRLDDKSDESNHSQTSVLGFLDLLLVVLFGGVVEVEGVETSLSLSPSEVTWGVAGSQSADSVDTEKIDKAHEGDHLPDSSVWCVADGGNGVGCNILKSRDACESWEDESKDGHLGDTSVHEFDLSVPFKSGKSGAVQEGKTVEVVSHQVSLGGKEAWVETNISWKASVKSGGGVLERKGLGWDSASRGSNRDGLGLLFADSEGHSGGSVGGGRTGEEGKGGELHVD